MNATLLKLARVGSIVAAIAVPAIVWAQQPGAGPQSFFSVSPFYEEADLDSGGDFSAFGVFVRGGTSRDIGGGNRAGITLNYDFTDYSFSDATAFGGRAPWNIVQRYGFSVPLSFALRDGWSVGVAPSVDWFKENGADTGDSLVWGATFSATKRFADGNLLGIGIAAFDRIEETSIIPFPIVNWRFGQRWRLLNPLAAGPTGAAGLELDYEFDNGWAVGIGAARRVQRFRLSDNGPTPNGVGEQSGFPVFLRARRDFGREHTLNLYAGVITGGELRVEDPSGNLIRKEDFDTGPLVGANFLTRF